MSALLAEPDAGGSGPILEEAPLEEGLLPSIAYSRAHERAADAYGLALATVAGYDPEGLVVHLERVAESLGEGPSWASTHPAAGERIEAAREMLGPP